MSAALIIFVRNPVLGKVKTRLAKTLGAENALKIYQKLLEHTHTVTQHLGADKYVFYADFVNEDDLWENECYKKEIQTGDHLGQRMLNAFSLVFAQGYREVLIIGSDCLELTPAIICTAIDHLQQTDVVIGPARDGGYYLLGMKTLIPQIFQNRQWGNNTVLRETITEIKRSNYSLNQLPLLNDVDEATDVHFTY